MDELIKYLKDRLNKKPINPRYALSQFKLNNEEYRFSYEYTDPLHYPFFYYLGKWIKPQNLLEMGFDIGIESGCFVKGCKTLNDYFGFKLNSQNYWSPRLACSNISNTLKRKIDFWHGDSKDSEFLKKFLSRKWDCVLMLKPEIINKYYMDLVWSQMPIGGYLIVNNINSLGVKDMFSNFCTIKNRQGFIFKTRYGSGIIMK